MGSLIYDFIDELIGDLVYQLLSDILVISDLPSELINEFTDQACCTVASGSAYWSVLCCQAGTHL